MRISVADARAFAAILNQGADTAAQAGQTDFDLSSEVEANYQDALAEAQAAIAAAKGPSSS